MRIFIEGDPRSEAKKRAWLQRRRRRDQLSRALFGHGFETMVAVAFILAGGICIGSAVLGSARAGWNVDTLSGSVLAMLPIGLGLAILPKTKDHD
jgi:hypothetical protein